VKCDTSWYCSSSAYLTTVLYLPDKILIQPQGHKGLLEQLSAVHVCQTLRSCTESECYRIHKMWPLCPVRRKFNPFSRFAVFSCLQSLILSSMLRTTISQAVASFKMFLQTKLCAHWSFYKYTVCRLDVSCRGFLVALNFLRPSGCCVSSQGLQ
jgi:hypothetical protein